MEPWAVDRDLPRGDGEGRDPASEDLNGRTGSGVYDAEWVGQAGLCVTGWWGRQGLREERLERVVVLLMGDIVSGGLGAWAPEHHRPNSTSWLISCVASSKLLNLAEPSVSKSVKWG